MRKAICPEARRSLCFKVLIILFFVIPQAVFALGTNYRFGGKELDPAAGLYYFDSRYYNPNTGRFIQPDPLANFLATPELQERTNMSLEDILANPQRLNYYSYAGNNPVVFIDPTGLLTIIIPGTFYSEKDWSQGGGEQAFINAVTKSFNETHSTRVVNDKNVWSGADNDAARRKAADYVVQLIKNYGFAPGEQLNIVGHSHGGNIALLVSRQIERKIDNLVTMATPVRSDYQPNPAMIGRHINAYSVLDMVQVMGGGFSLSKLMAGLLFGPLGGWLGQKFNFGEFGLAGRTYGGAENVDVTKESRLNLIGSHFMTKMPAVWTKIQGLFR